MNEQQKPYRVEVRIQAPREDVWRALTDTGEIRNWFGWDYDGLDEEIRFIFVEHSHPQPPDRIVGHDGQYLELAADGDATIVRAIMPGPLDDARWENVYDGVEEGWRTFLEQLRYWLERRPPAPRRTVYLAGVVSGADLLSVIDRGTAAQRWHDSHMQRMIVEGDTLIGVAAQQPLDSPQAGPASVTVSTYGCDDATFEAVRDDWTRRWQGIAGAETPS